jgi:tetratricopeptide (TPR) repeat protein
LQKKDADALNDYNASIQANPQDTLALRGRAEVFVAMRRYNDAITDLQNALQLRPGDPELTQNLQYAQQSKAIAEATPPPPPPPKPTPTPRPKPTPTPDPGLITPTNLKIGIIALAVIIFAGIIVVMKRKPADDY